MTAPNPPGQTADQLPTDKHNYPQLAGCGFEQVGWVRFDGDEYHDFRYASPEDRRLPASAFADQLPVWAATGYTYEGWGYRNELRPTPTLVDDLRSCLQAWEPRVRCPQCGQRYSDLACGPTHAVVAQLVRGES